jgi:hypothetical protein
MPRTPLPALGRRVPPDWRHVERYRYAAPTPAAVERVLPLPPTWMMSILNRRRYDPVWLWNEAKTLDASPATAFGDRNETTLRAALDVLRLVGHVRDRAGRDRSPSIGDGIAENRWATTVDEIRASIAAGVPVVLGISWYRSFDAPTREGPRWWIGRGQLGRVAGGHAICVHGASDRLGAVHAVNSWGLRYPPVLLPYDVLGRLLTEDGEASLVTDRPER